MFGYDVLCVGSATLDRFLTITQPLSSIKAGDKILASKCHFHSGGGATNGAAAMSSLGLRVKMLTKVGDDHDGDFILKEMQEFGVKNVCHTRSFNTTDSSTIIYSQVDKDRIIFTHKGASQDLSREDYSRFQLRPKWIYLASLLGKSFDFSKDLAKECKQKKIPFLFNPSLYLASRGIKVLAPILQATTVLILNKKEAQSLLGMKERDSFVLAKSLRNNSLQNNSLQKSGPQIVIITDGKNKLVAIDQHHYYSLIPPNVTVTDTAGAGDAFNAGFLTGIIHQLSFDNCLRLGQVNALSVIQSGGTKNGLLSFTKAKKQMLKYRIKVRIKKIKD